MLNVISECEMPNKIDDTPKVNTQPGWGCLARTYERGDIRLPHSHPQGQLLFAITGVMLVESANKRWVIPPQRALWLPSNVEHTFNVFSRTELRTVYFEPPFIALCQDFKARDEVHVIAVTDLFRQLIAGMFDQNYNAESHRLMASLLLQVLSETEILPAALPMPLDSRLHRAALEMMMHNNWHASLSQLAELATMSERTFSRQFVKDTGFTLRGWKQWARIYASLDLLANGISLKQIAFQLGFSCPAAFTAAFREVMGSTPGQFQQ